MVSERRGWGQAAQYSSVPHSVPEHRALVFWQMLQEYFLTKQDWGRGVLWAAGDHLPL